MPLPRWMPDSATLHLVGDDRTDVAYAARVRHRLGQPDLSDRVVVHGPKIDRGGSGVLLGS